MRTKKFSDYLTTRLSSTEIIELEAQVLREKTILETLQKDIAHALESYMAAEEIGFNELIRRLDMSPTKASNIRKGKANLTLASIAHLFALIKKEPQLNFK